MKFDLIDMGNGSHATPLTIDNLRNSGATPMVFVNKVYFSSKQVMRFEKISLEATWQYWIFYKDAEVYWFDCQMNYNITEEDVEATEEQGKELITKTYNKLQETWDNRKNTEVNFFPSIHDLGTETFDLALQNLMQTLADKPE